MPTAAVHELVALNLADRRLLDHPFYRRWERGDVTMSELAEYAGQYRHFETWLPGYLARLLAQLPPGKARDLVAANLDDELGDPVPHVELFEGFARGVSAPAAAPSDAMASLLATYDGLLDSSPIDGLAGFVAYEVQAADVARNKADGLRRHYGLANEAVAFWEHHADVDVSHADWAVSALGLMAEEPSETGVSVRRAANAWWRFLDEREAVGQAA
jgi:pyrroloquinoline-quinone synthase